jgi:hypothetical protein
LPNLVSSLTGGKLTYAIGDLAALPRAALVVEDRYSQIFKLEHVRPATVADGLAELQLRWPNVPIVFTETRPLAAEWTYRYLAAADTWATTEPDALPAPASATGISTRHRAHPEPSTAEVRAWARGKGVDVPHRGRLRPEIWQAWRAANDHG